jgi:hypothetical protein
MIIAEPDPGHPFISLRQSACLRHAGAAHPRDEAYNRFLAELDPRGNSERSKVLHFALACSDDVRFHEFHKRLFQPRYRSWSPAAVAVSCDIRLDEFKQFWHQAQTQHIINMA